MSLMLPEVSVLGDALAQIHEGAKGYNTAQSYYDNVVPERFPDIEVAKRYTRDPNAAAEWRAGYAHTPIDVLAGRTHVGGWDCAQPSSSAYLAQWWDDSMLGLQAKKLHRGVYTNGDYYAIANPDAALRSRVRVHIIDPRFIRSFYADDNPITPTHSVQWLVITGNFVTNGLQTGRRYLRVNFYRPDGGVDLYVSTDPIDDFGRVRKDLDLTRVPIRMYGELAPNVPGVSPVFHFRNDMTYGVPEHKVIYPIQDMINKTLIGLMSMIGHAAGPQRYIQTSNGGGGGANPWKPRDASGKTGGMQVDFNSSYGDAWLIGGADSVGQFPAAESDNALGPVRSFITMAAEAKQMPRHFFSQSDVAVSADSIHAGNISVNAMASEKHEWLGPTWARLAQYSQQLAGQQPDARVIWSPPESFNDKTSWDSATASGENGVSTQQRLRERSYTDEQIAAMPAEIAAWEVALEVARAKARADAGIAAPVAAPIPSGNAQ